MNRTEAPRSETAQADWWAETVRRCKEAEMHPEQMIEAGVFFEVVRADIAALRRHQPK